MSDLRNWRKSTHCGNSFSCVEVGQGAASVGVRDTELERSPVLVFPAEAWAAFAAAVKAGAAY
jgi:hypothetical protein